MTQLSSLRTESLGTLPMSHTVFISPDSCCVSASFVLHSGLRSQSKRKDRFPSTDSDSPEQL